MQKKIFKSNLLAIASIVLLYTFFILLLSTHFTFKNANAALYNEMEIDVHENMSYFDQQIESISRATNGIISKNSVIKYLNNDDSSYYYFKDIYSDIIDSYSYLDHFDISIGITKLEDNLVVSNDGYFNIDQYFNYIVDDNNFQIDFNQIQVNKLYTFPGKDSQGNPNILFLRKYYKMDKELVTLFTIPMHYFTKHISEISLNLYLNIAGDIFPLLIKDDTDQLLLDSLNPVINNDSMKEYQNWLVSHATSSILPEMTLLQFEPKISLIDHFKLLLLPFMASLLILFTIGALITILFSKRLYSPVQLLLNKLKSFNSENDKQVITNELNYIEEKIDKLFSDNSLLIQVFDETISYRQKEFLSSLIVSPNHSPNHSPNFNDKINELNLTAFNHTNLMVFYTFEGLDTEMKTLSTNDLVDLRTKLITLFLKEHITLEFNILPIDVQTYCLVIALKDDTNVPDLLNSFKRKAHTHLNLALTINTHTIFDSLKTFRATYIETLKSLSHGNLTTKINYSINHELNLINAILSNDRTTAEQMIDTILTDTILTQISVSSIEITGIKYALLNTISRILVNYDSTFEDFHIENKILFEHISSVNPTVLYKVFSRIFASIFDLFIFKSSQVTDATTLNIIKYIDENALKDLTLADLSEIFSLSESHISRLLKKNASINFKKYTTSIKLDVAKQLLLDPDMKVNEISQYVGFTNVNSFIRTFKKEIGITPGEFSKQQNLSNLNKQDLE